MSGSVPSDLRPVALDAAVPAVQFDIAAELAQLHASGQWSSGQNAKTLLKTDDLRVVLMALRAERSIPGHKADGRVTIHAIAGRVRLNAAGETFELAPGQVLALDHGVPHDVYAVEESALLLTVAAGGR